MTTYDLYLESGPRRKKTMVHVPALLGCVANGPTTEEGLELTPGAIRDFEAFLARHDPSIVPSTAVDLRVAEHVTEGIWLGNGDPSIVFATDLEPLSEEELEACIQHLGWMHEELLELVGGLSDAQLDEKPPRGRPIRQILAHTLESEASYMTAFGRIEGLPGAGSILTKQEGDLLSWLGYVRAQEYARLRALTPEERSQPFIHWKHTRTARKVLRRMLEHQWEHLVEIRARLAEA
jgi:uncharacterized damage-inducible protein DinB/predicted RNase H-like HicB family nuclease